MNFFNLISTLLSVWYVTSIIISACSNLDGEQITWDRFPCTDMVFADVLVSSQAKCHTSMCNGYIYIMLSSYSCYSNTFCLCCCVESSPIIIANTGISIICMYFYLFSVFLYILHLPIVSFHHHHTWADLSVQVSDRPSLVLVRLSQQHDAD